MNFKMRVNPQVKTYSKYPCSLDLSMLLPDFSCLTPLPHLEV